MSGNEPLMLQQLNTCRCAGKDGVSETEVHFDFELHSVSSPRKTDGNCNGERSACEQDKQIGFLIHDVSRLRRTAFDRLLKPFKLNRAQWAVLAYLNSKNAVSQATMADELDLSRSATGGLIDRLEEAGLVRRNIDALDRRSNLVRIEDRGTNLISTLQELNDQFDKITLKDMHANEVKSLTAALRKLKHGLQAQLKASSATAPPALHHAVTMPGSNCRQR